MPSSLRRLVLPALFAAVIGCAGKNAEKNGAKVSGKITYKNAPYTSGGTIRFEIASDPAKFASVAIPASGEYTIPNAPIGDNLVSIENSSVTMMMDAKAKAKFVPFDKKYANTKTSQLTATIKSGTNTENFDLK